MRHYIFLPLAALVSNIVLGLYIFYLSPKEKLSRLYILVIIALLVWSLGDLRFLTAYSVSSARLGDILASCGGYLTSLFILWFFIAFTKHKLSKKLMLGLSLPILVLEFLEPATGLIVKTTQLTADRYVIVPGVLYGFDIIFISIYAVCGLVLSLKYYFKSSKAGRLKEKHQAMLLTIAVSVPVAFAVVMEVIVAVLGKQVIPISSVATSITAIIIAYAIVKHDLLVITPAKAVDNIVKTMADFLLVFDYEKKLVIANESVLEITNKKESELVGQNYRKLPFNIEDLFEELEKTSFVNDYETKMLKDDQDVIDLSVNASVMRDKKGEAIGYVLLMRDVTEKNKLIALLKDEKASVEKKVEERTRELVGIKADLSASIENLPLGFLIADMHGHVILTNPIARNVLASGSEKTYVDMLKTYLASAGVSFDEYVKKAAVDKTRLNIDELQIGGHFYQFLLSPVLVKEEGNRCIGIVILIQDITEAKILKRSKDEFFSIASHELRTPLTAIMGNASILSQYFNNDLEDSSVREIVDDINQASVRLIGIVNDFMDASSLEQGRISYDLKPLKVLDVVEKVIGELSASASQNNISLAIATNLINSNLPKSIADEDRLKQILCNLVGNAIRYTKPGGHITVDGSVVNNQLRISVIDDGQGIALDLQPLLFRKLQQAGESLLTRDYTKGTGLGLYISRLLAKGMGGNVYLEKSEVGKGSTFVIILPAETASKPVVSVASAD